MQRKISSVKDKLILLTNDDGIKSSGLDILRKELKKVGKVVCFGSGVDQIRFPH